MKYLFRRPPGERRRTSYVFFLFSVADLPPASWVICVCFLSKCMRDTSIRVHRQSVFIKNLL